MNLVLLKLYVVTAISPVQQLALVILALNVIRNMNLPLQHSTMSCLYIVTCTRIYSN